MPMELVIYGARQFGIKVYFFWMRWLLRIFMGDFLGSMVTAKHMIVVTHDADRVVPC